MRLRQQRQGGMALLLAMLTVTLVASLSAAAYWQQWRSWQVEQAEQERQQAAWLLTGALDWARLILREDARASTVDHLAEPWAVPLQEARLSSFLATQSTQDTNSALDAFLSGEVTDMQGRLNLRNLLQDGDKGEISTPDAAVFNKLFSALGLPAQELDRLIQLLPAALGKGTNTKGQAPLAPVRFEQLAWLGLSKTTLLTLAPHATWLPERTTLNINTASAVALSASVAGLDLAQAQNILRQRSRQHFKTLEEVRALTPGLSNQWKEQQHGTSSRFFEVRGQLRLDDLAVQETSLVVRNGVDVNTLWRQKGQTTPPQAKLAE